MAMTFAPAVAIASLPHRLRAWAAKRTKLGGAVCAAGGGGANRPIATPVTYAKGEA